MATPKVNFFVKYYSPNYKSKAMQEKRKYYSSNKAKDYMNYIISGINEFKSLDYVTYMQSREKSRGIFNQDGLISDDYKKELRNKLRKTKSIIWDCVISFEEVFGKTWVNCYEQAYELMKTELPKFFKRCGLNPENIEWFAGLHENTDNRHIHLCFFEKKPIRIRPNKKGKQFSIGKLSNVAMQEFRANLELSATDFKAIEIKNRQTLKQAIVDELRAKSGFVINNKLLSLGSKIYDIEKCYYSSNDIAPFRAEIDDITTYLINKSSVATSAYNEFIEQAKYKDELFANYCKRNHCKQPFTFERKYMKDIYRRLGNEVLHYAVRIKAMDIRRLKLNASYKSQKYAQKKSLFRQLNECLKASVEFDKETMKAFDDYLKKLDEVRYKTLVEEEYIEAEM